MSPIRLAQKSSECLRALALARKNQPAVWRSHRNHKPFIKCQPANDWPNGQLLAHAFVPLVPISCITAALYRKWKHHRLASSIQIIASHWPMILSIRSVSIWAKPWSAHENIWDRKLLDQDFKVLWMWIWLQVNGSSSHIMDVKVLLK